MEGLRKVVSRGAGHGLAARPQRTRSTPWGEGESGCGKAKGDIYPFKCHAHQLHIALQVSLLRLGGSQSKCITFFCWLHISSDDATFLSADDNLINIWDINNNLLALSGFFSPFSTQFNLNASNSCVWFATDILNMRPNPADDSDEVLLFNWVAGGREREREKRKEERGTFELWRLVTHIYTLAFQKITTAAFHPIQCNQFVYATNTGTTCICDTRRRLNCARPARGMGWRWFVLSKIIVSVCVGCWLFSVWIRRASPHILHRFSRLHILCQISPTRTQHHCGVLIIAASSLGHSLPCDWCIYVCVCDVFCADARLHDSEAMGCTARERSDVHYSCPRRVVWPAAYIVWEQLYQRQVWMFFKPWRPVSCIFVMIVIEMEKVWQNTYQCEQICCDGFIQ